MAIGFGAGSDMMGAYNSNRKQLKRSNNLKEAYDTFGVKSKNKKAAYKEISKEKLEELKLKQKEQKRKDDLILYTVLGVITIAFGIGMFYFLFK
jgi:coproporphyrinogen III oxidase-like Fe-S oxidoreductase